MIQAAPCPRCGAPADINYNPPPIPPRNCDWHVNCSEVCGEDSADVAYGTTREAAIREWNTLRDESEGA